MSEGERVGTKTKVHINLDLIVAEAGKEGMVDKLFKVCFWE